jgi:hypothetical protein
MSAAVIDPLDALVTATAATATATAATDLTAPVDPPPPSAEAAPDHPPTPESVGQNRTESGALTPNPYPILTGDPRQLPLASKQLIACQLLTSGKTVVAVAATLGVARSTIYEWRKDPAFAAELAHRQLDLAQTTDLRCRRLLLHATHAALAGLTAKKNPDQFRNALRVITAMRPWMSRLDQLLKIDPPKEDQ